MAQATLIYYLKDYLHDERFILELKIYSIRDFKRFPDGIKYSLYLLDQKSGKSVLMDNHHPKGHHYHLGDHEFEYVFQSEQKLIEDFKKYVYQYEGKGLMSAAVSALEKTCFEIGFNRVEIRCSSLNLNSAGVPKRLGYKLDGTLRQDSLEKGKYRDTLVFSKLKTEIQE